MNSKIRSRTPYTHLMSDARTTLVSAVKPESMEPAEVKAGGEATHYWQGSVVEPVEHSASLADLDVQKSVTIRCIALGHQLEGHEQLRVNFAKRAASLVLDSCRLQGTRLCCAFGPQFCSSLTPGTPCNAFKFGVIIPWGHFQSRNGENSANSRQQLYKTPSSKFSDGALGRQIVTRRDIMLFITVDWCSFPRP